MSVSSPRMDLHLDPISNSELVSTEYKYFGSMGEDRNPEYSLKKYAKKNRIRSLCIIYTNKIKVQLSVALTAPYNIV